MFLYRKHTHTYVCVCGRRERKFALPRSLSLSVTRGKKKAQKNDDSASAQLVSAAILILTGNDYDDFFWGAVACWDRSPRGWFLAPKAGCALSTANSGSASGGRVENDVFSRDFSLIWGRFFFLLNFSSLLNSGIFFVTFSRTEKRHPHLPHALFRGGDTHNLRHRVEPGSTISSGSTEEGQTNSTDTHTHTLDARNMVHRNPPLPYPFEPNCSAAEPVESSTNFCSCSCC